MTDTNELVLEQLFEDLPGVTRAGAESCYEAIVICLEHHSHMSGARADVRDLDKSIATFDLLWARQIEDTTRRAWGEPRNAVELAAVGLAHVLMPMFTQYTLIQRSNVGEGIDYWLGFKDDVIQFKFQRKGRLEISGILDAPRLGQVTRRVREKMEQTARSDYTGLPAFVIVTEFGRPLIYLVQK